MAWSTQLRTRDKHCFVRRYYEHAQRFAAMAAAIKLSRALSARLWDGCQQQCRQLPGIGRQLGDRLAAAGFGSLQALLAADARVLERAVDKAYPWGNTKKEEARKLLPPRCSIGVELSGACCTCQSTAAAPATTTCMQSRECTRVLALICCCARDATTIVQTTPATFP